MEQTFVAERSLEPRLHLHRAKFIDGEVEVLLGSDLVFPEQPGHGRPVAAVNAFLGLIEETIYLALEPVASHAVSSAVFAS